MKYEMYHLHSLSDIHPGTGKDDFSPIDQLVQRNSFGHPTIQNSAVKGAIRENFEATFKEKSDEVTHIFGGKKSVKKVIDEDLIADEWKLKLSKNEKAELDRLLSKIFDAKEINRAGTYNFNECLLISIPVRTNPGVYANVFCPLILSQILAQIKIANTPTPEINRLKNLCDSLLASVGKSTDDMPFSYSPSVLNNTILEDDRVKVKKQEATSDIDLLLSTFGEYPVMVSDGQFKLLTDNFHLPVIRRNHLKKEKKPDVDGVEINQTISDNVWSEQILPRWSRFLTLVAIPPKDIYRDVFIKHTHNAVIDFGGNLSTGYGSLYCRILSGSPQLEAIGSSSLRAQTS